MECSRPWLLALCVLVLLNAVSLHGSWQLTQEAADARQQTAAWKTYALTAHGQGLWAVELDAQVMAGTAAPLPRFSF
jgi:hypothetical protein